MQIVLLQDLGVPQAFLDREAAKLEAMGHSLLTYPASRTAAEQVERCADAEAIILADMALAPEVVEKSVFLRFIDVAFTGVDRIPVKAAKTRGITVSNAAGYATEAVAELTIGFFIDLLRQVPQMQARCRNGGTKAGLTLHELAAKTIGIVGAGTIGRRVAALCKAFGAQVTAASPHHVDDPNIDVQMPLPELLKTADIVSLHCPLTDKTRDLIGKTELGLMKETAFLVNTARGPIVDKAALLDALTAGRIAGAALDVFDAEPPLSVDDPLLKLPNVLLTPHIGYYTQESMEDRARIAFQNLHAWLAGKPQNVIC